MRRTRAALAALAVAVSAVPGLVALASPAGARAGEPRLLTADARGVTFELDVPEPVLARVEAKNGIYHQLSLEGFAWDAGAGEPLLPVTGVWIAIPEGARLHVEATGEGARTFDDVRLVPQQELPEARKGGTTGPTRSSATGLAPESLTPGEMGSVQSSGVPASRLDVDLVEDAAVYGRAGFGDTPLASIKGVSWLREQRVANIAVRPAAFDPVSRRVQVWSKVRVRVSFEGGSATGAAGPGSVVGAVADGGPFERIYKDALLNYESARTWRRDLRAEGALHREAASTALGGGRNDFSASPNWLRIAVPTKRVYRVDAADLSLAGVNLASIDPATIRVFVKPGLPLLNELLPPSGWLSEVAINVVGEGDGTFDPSDYLLFYGLGASGWRDDYTSPGAATGWLDHPYETRNTYWMTWGGGFAGAPRRFASRDASPTRPGAMPAQDFPSRLHFEQNVEYYPSLQEGFDRHEYSSVLWDKWAWFNVRDDAGPVPFTFNLPGAVTTKPARLFARLWGNSRETDPDRVVQFDHYLNVDINGLRFNQRRFNFFFRQDYDTVFNDVRETANRMTVRCSLITDPRNPARSDEVAVFFFDVEFQRFLRPVGNLLEFRSADTTGIDVEYAVGPFTSTAGLLILDTSNPLSPVALTGAVERDTTGGKAIYFDDDTPSPRSYLAVTSGNLRRPDAVTRVSVDDLGASSNGADYLIVTYDDFLPAAQTLAAQRERRLPAVTSPRARAVKISDVYAWYSGGRTDPTAIRNFVYDLVKNGAWAGAPPSYVCLLGDASYDFKNIYRLAQPGQPASLVPPYQNGWQTRQFMTDDWLVDVDLGEAEPFPRDPGTDSIFFDLPDLMVGRLPATSLDEANFLVTERTIAYEESPDFGEWRQRGLMVADDITQGFDPDPLTNNHIYESENISEGFIPDQVEQRKVYLIRYTYGSGSEKPGANRDVKQTVDEGVVYWNYIGHGNPVKMADENCFILADVGSLTNRLRPTFMVAASCDLGKFDDPVTIGLGEALIRARNGGAIATFSASDIAFAFSNVSLAKELFRRVFEVNSDGYFESLGGACLLAKLRALPSVNDLKFILMGDPAIRLAMPQSQVRLSLADADTDAPVDSLKRGRRVRIRGEVHRSHDPLVNVVDAAFNGAVALLVTDSPPMDSARGFYGEGNGYARYRYDPGTIFRGDAQVVSGRFDATFIMPLEAFTGDGGRVQAYVTDGQTDGGGVLVRNVVTGVPLYADSTGPTIGLAFTSGTLEVPPDAVLRIAVSDESGINLTGHTIPNGLFLSIDGRTRVDLTKDFRYEPGSYQGGTVEFPLPNLTPGPHSIVVSAADNYAQGVLGRQNRSTATIDFEVLATGGAFDVGRVYNFPNPFKTASGTTFVLTGLSEPARVQVKIYSVSGSLVRALDVESSAGQAQIFWDGTDAYGDQVSNGAYLYLVQAVGSSSGAVVKTRGRAAVLN